MIDLILKIFHNHAFHKSVFWFGFAVLTLALLAIVLCIIWFLSCTLSYYLFLVVCVTKHRKWSAVEKRKVPFDFFVIMADFHKNGVPNRITTYYGEWRDVFDWEVFKPEVTESNEQKVV